MWMDFLSSHFLTTIELIGTKSRSRHINGFQWLRQTTFAEGDLTEQIHDCKESKFGLRTTHLNKNSFPRQILRKLQCCFRMRGMIRNWVSKHNMLWASHVYLHHVQQPMFFNTAAAYFLLSYFDSFIVIVCAQLLRGCG